MQRDRRSDVPGLESPLLQCQAPTNRIRRRRLREGQPHLRRRAQERVLYNVHARHHSTPSVPDSPTDEPPYTRFFGVLALRVALAGQIAPVPAREIPLTNFYPLFAFARIPHGAHTSYS
jgi:hypothetical protein